MLEEVQESNIDQTNGKMKQIDLKPVIQYEQSYSFVITYLENIVQMTETSQKMEKYLSEINLTCKEFRQSFFVIIDSFKELHQKSKKTTVMRHGIGKGWIFLEEFFKTKDISKKDTKGKTVWFLEIEAKLSCCLEFLHSFKEYEDITNSPKESYANVWEKIKVDPVSDQKKLKKDLKSLKKMLHTAASAVLNEQSHDFKLAKLFSFGCSFPKYTIMSDSGKLRSLEYYRKPTIEMAQKLWNLQQNGAIREFSKLVYEGIKTNKKIYLPPDGHFTNKTDIFTENPNHITVRILYNKKLRIYEEGQSFACCVSGPKQVKEIDTVLLHFHGGGFIALSSRSMQIYTRRWANQLDIPIFSVDYRMPPQHPFPQAPYDCFLVYQFLLNHVHKFMNVRPTNIFLAGDSAGGNLCLSLTGLILKHKQTIPKGIYMAYPATDLRMLFTQSKIYSMTDVFLWPSTLLLCLKQYLQGDNSKAIDPLASPLLISEEWIGGVKGDQRFPINWPKTMLTVGSKDPLFDDSLNLMQRMVASGVDCECLIYDQLSHGYLNSDLVISEAQKTVKHSIEHLKELISPYITKTKST